jgi:hypothetical protein
VPLETALASSLMAAIQSWVRLQLEVLLKNGLMGLSVG